ncbi:MAG: hypothetical protein U1E51_08435 [Candidatus Binatia bacterium]|nr:hypothetical protein [Candidatus Binatia bacterium]
MSPACAEEKQSLIECAREYVERDDKFIAEYRFAFLSFAAFAFLLLYWWEPQPQGCKGDWLWPWICRPIRFDRWSPWIHAAALVLAIFTLVWWDRLENECLKERLAGFVSCPHPRLRFYTEAKFITLAIVCLGLLMTLLAGVRRQFHCWFPSHTALADLESGGNFVAGIKLKVATFTAHVALRLAPIKTSLVDKCPRWLRSIFTRTTRANDGSGGNFEALIKIEQRDLHGAAIDPKLKIEKGPAAEPRVSFCEQDYLGLALSGGGIRSATFNLGLLQGLHRIDLLKDVDYLSTVSGGGYIGGFWSRWLRVKEGPGHSDIKKSFPDNLQDSGRQGADDSRLPEVEEVRHLREFGKFLVPRTGFFDTETWGAVVSVLAGLLPALLAALSVLGLALVVWLALTFYLSCPELWARIAFLVCLTLAVFITMELWWRAEQPRGTDLPSWPGFLLQLIIPLAAVALAAYLMREAWKVWLYSPPKGVWLYAGLVSSYQNWWTLVGIIPPARFPEQSLVSLPWLYEPSIAWGFAALVALAMRFRGAFMPPSMARRVSVPRNDRTAMRLVGVASLWTLLTTLWHVGLNLHNLNVPLEALGGGAAGSAGLFALLRNWIGQNLNRAQGTGFWEKIKPYIPQILAYLAVGLAWSGLASGLIRLNHADWYNWYWATFAMAAIALLVVLVDPHEFGLHAVYRDRICRAFLGAAYPVMTETGRAVAKAKENRQTDLRPKDDLPLASLRERPLHLVCCAANNLGGDHLETLSRGACSAVLSRNGVAMGDHWIRQPGLKLGSALTASAAAANSNMGSVSMRLGPAVGFLMSALNIRVGLWVDNPARRDEARRNRLLPGALFYKEMFSFTTFKDREIHLSDGAHFDNLGLYELVRRHCRYIIVSDCTADPEVAFDDFGNTARRIREDFDIEIDIDIEPLRPGTQNRAAQHAVVGTIDYGWFDKGTLLYIKPGLTGDEPVDVLQYKTRNLDFPHEGTGDQFYGEAQWESYRRLGVHTVNQVFSFDDRASANHSGYVQQVFERARQMWHPTPPGLADRSLELTGRLTLLEDQLKADTKVSMLPEIFPELKSFAGSTQGGGAAAQASRLPEADLANLGYLLKVLSLMEDTVHTGQLQTHWSHPLNLGWVNLFARWATAPNFRRWWPLLKVMYSPALREFLEDRFVVLREPSRIHAEVIEFDFTAPQTGYTIDWWTDRDVPPADLHRWRERDVPPNYPVKRKGFQYFVTLPGRDDERPLMIQIALVAVKFVDGTASWTSDHFFVPLSLWGSPMIVEFLDRLTDKLKEYGARDCVVEVKGPEKNENNRAKWDERQSFIEFYRRGGFRIEDTKISAGLRCAVLKKSLVP